MKNLKKGLGVDLQLLTNWEKTLLVDALKRPHALPDLLTELGLARAKFGTEHLAAAAARIERERRACRKNVINLAHFCHTRGERRAANDG
ncbi:MAG TPA: hypothetical protein VHQ87_01805 [Rhizobacter sp.]|nr:hypothetical protein [Rhizobacter sp.]